MVHFFGIFGPGALERNASAEAPRKANFFGGLPDAALGAVPLSRAEQDACYLAGKVPVPFQDLERHAPSQGTPER